jgi:hypothetical protein
MSRMIYILKPRLDIGATPILDELIAQSTLGTTSVCKDSAKENTKQSKQGVKIKWERTLEVKRSQMN